MADAMKKTSIFFSRVFRTGSFFTIDLIKKTVVGILSVFGVPIFLLRHRHLFHNDIVYVFWHGSFGHTIAGLDYASRLYYPSRISLIVIPHQGLNPYLPFCFGHNVDAVLYHHALPGLSGSADRLTYDILRFALLVLSGITRKFQVIEHANIYKTLSVANGNIFVGREEEGVLERYVDWTGYLRLLRDGIGKKPQLPDALIADCRRAILQVHPDFFDRPFVTMLLREKGRSGAFDNAMRCVGRQEHYIAATAYLTTHGYRVVGTGETNHTHFTSISGYYTMQGVQLPEKLLNLFLLMHCTFFIGQQAGPYTLLNSCGIPCCITDALPHRLGTFAEEDIILFKRLRIRGHDHPLSLVDIFTAHQDLAYGYHFKKKNILIEPNSSEEILEAVKEMVSRLASTPVLSSEDTVLCKKFLELPAEGMPLRYQRNRTSLHVLRQMKDELLAPIER